MKASQVQMPWICCRKETMLPLLFKFYLPVQVVCSCKTANALKRLKNTHREKTPSNKTIALRKSKDMGVWATGT